MKKIDFLAIGDITVDAFIKLKDAHIHCNIDKQGCELCVRFGDKIPYEEVKTISAAGNSGNASVCAARLGLKTALLTNIGNDQNGELCLETLKKEKVNSLFVKKEKNQATNYHYVLWYDVDRTILVKHQNYERIWPKKLRSKRYIPTWIYLSSLGENSQSFYSEIIKYLEEHPEVKLAFQPGTFQIKSGREALKDIYARTEIFFSNIEEAKRILGKERVGEDKNILELCKEINALGPKMVSLSDGLNGAYLYFNKELWHQSIYPNNSSLIESTGAGDAFSATFTSALALGKNTLEAFSWSLINPMSVIQKIGPQAGLLSREKLEEYLKNAPESYKTTKMF